MPEMLRLTLVLSGFLILNGCATMPAELAGGGPYAEIAPAQVRGDAYQGRRVRWGGTVVQVRPEETRTCFEMLALELDSQAEPIDSDRSMGRFVACAEGFYDPAIYSHGRNVTFTGQIQGSAAMEIGERRFEFPKLQADTVHLWPKRRDVRYVPYAVPYWDPFYDPYWRYERWR